MTQDRVMEIMTDTLFTAFKLAAPMLLVSMLVGLVIAIIQAATQVHEQTLTFLPKLVAIALALLFMGPWMIDTMNEFVTRLFAAMALYV